MEKEVYLVVERSLHPSYIGGDFDETLQPRAVFETYEGAKEFIDDKVWGDYEIEEIEMYFK